jgi:hypothetical protein
MPGIFTTFTEKDAAFVIPKEALGYPMFMYDLLNQQMFWVNKGGLALSLLTMSVRYKLNVINRLHKDCVKVRKQYLKADLALKEKPMSAAKDSSGKTLTIPVTVKLWLDSTPLVQELRSQILQGIGGPDDPYDP